MKRVAAAVVLTAAWVAPGAAAAPGEPRVHTLEYAGGGITAGPGQSVEVRAGETIGAVVFRGGPERFVSIEIEDAHGLPVTGVVEQDDDATHVCGATRKPLRIRPYENVTVFLMNGACGGSSVSVATTGTVTATFTRR